MLNSDRVQRDAEKSSERIPFENLNLIQITNTTSEQPEIQTAEIETTAYALLSYVSHGDVGGSLPIVRWLSSKRNNLGGFSSTQDTTIALYALSKYAELTHINGIDLTVNIRPLSNQYSHTIKINDRDATLSQQRTLTKIPDQIFVEGKGVGCGLVNIHVAYNIPESDKHDSDAFAVRAEILNPTYSYSHSFHSNPNSNPFSNSISNSIVGSEKLWLTSNHHNSQVIDRLVSDFHLEIKVCAIWLHSGASNMAVMELPLPSGFDVDMNSLRKLEIDKSRTAVKNTEAAGRKILLYFDEISSQCRTCIKIKIKRSFIVGKTQLTMPIRIYDYYEPSFQASTYYESDIFELSKDYSENAKKYEDNGEFTNEKNVKNMKELARLEMFIREQEKLQREENITLNRGDQFNLLDTISDCTCHRDCDLAGPIVCGSNLQVYDNLCRMRMDSCQTGQSLRKVEYNNCEALNIDFDIETARDNEANVDNEDMLNSELHGDMQNEHSRFSLLETPELLRLNESPNSEESVFQALSSDLEKISSSIHGMSSEIKSLTDEATSTSQFVDSRPVDHEEMFKQEDIFESDDSFGNEGFGDQFEAPFEGQFDGHFDNQNIFDDEIAHYDGIFVPDMQDV